MFPPSGFLGETMQHVLEGGREMVEEHCRVVLLKLPDEPPPLFD